MCISEEIKYPILRQPKAYQRTISPMKVRKKRAIITTLAATISYIYYYIILQSPIIWKLHYVDKRWIGCIYMLTMLVCFMQDRYIQRLVAHNIKASSHQHTWELTMKDVSLFSGILTGSVRRHYRIIHLNGCDESLQSLNNLYVPPNRSWV